MPGPPPKRSDQRRRRNKDSQPEVARVSFKPAEPYGEDRSWHPLAKRWYRSLKSSGQARYYQQSDWAAACIAAEHLSRILNDGRIRAGAMETAWKMMNDLLTTEAERRRVRLEIEMKPVDEDQEASVAVLADYQKELSG